MFTRRTLMAAVAAGSTALLAACGGEGENAAGGGGSDDGGDGAFPVTITTAFGDVEVPEQPQRVVALGWGDAEVALSLDVQPVGASDWIGFGGEGIGPWAEGLYDEAPTIIETLEPDFEAIATLEPDLILDVKSSGDQDRYERLSQITTTVGIPEGAENYLVSSADQLTMIGQALGRSDQAQKVQEDLDALFASTSEEHPEFEGTTVCVATRTSEGWGAYVDGDVRLGFLQNLGFVQSETIAELPAGDSGFSVSVSEEQLDQFDADLVVAFPIYIETTEITDDSAWKEIPAVADGRSVVVDGDLSSAFSLGTALAQEYALEQLPEQLQDAIG